MFLDSDTIQVTSLRQKCEWVQEDRFSGFIYSLHSLGPTDMTYSQKVGCFYLRFL